MAQNNTNTLNLKIYRYQIQVLGSDLVLTDHKLTVWSDEVQLLKGNIFKSQSCCVLIIIYRHLEQNT